MRKTLTLALLASLSGGCARYRPHPIDPVRTETQYRQRKPSDPVLAACLAATGAASPPARLDLGALVTIAACYSAELETARAARAAAEAGVVSAGGRPNPSIAAGRGYDKAPENHTLYNFLPSFTIETAGKRRLRLLQARERAAVAGLALEEAAWQLRSRVRAALADYTMALRALELTQREEGIRKEIAVLWEERLRAGEASRLELDAARSDLAASGLEREAATGTVAHRRAALAGALSVPVSFLENAKTDESDLRQPPVESALPLQQVQREGLLHRADVRRLLAEYAAADAGLRLELAAQYPDIQLGPGYSFESGFPRYTLGVNLIVPVFYRNRGQIAEAEARRRESAGRFTALQTQALAEMEKALAQYRSALAELQRADTRRAGIEGPRQEAVRRAVEAGEADRLFLTFIRLQGNAAERARLDALRRAQAAFLALEDAAQNPLDSSAGAPPAIPDRRP